MIFYECTNRKCRYRSPVELEFCPACEFMMVEKIEE